MRIGPSFQKVLEDLEMSIFRSYIEQCVSIDVFFIYKMFRIVNFSDISFRMRKILFINLRNQSAICYQGKKFLLPPHPSECICRKINPCAALLRHCNRSRVNDFVKFFNLYFFGFLSLKQGDSKPNIGKLLPIPLSSRSFSSTKCLINLKGF